MRNDSTTSTTCAIVVAALVAIGFSLVAPSSAAAATLFFDDFQNAWPPDWTPKWNANDLSNNGLRSDPADPNNPVLKLYGVENWSASATRPVAFSDNFVVSARVWNGAEPRRDGWGRGSIGLEGGSTLFTFYSDGTFPGGNPPLAMYETERWYDTRVHYQRQGSDVTLRYWLDNNYVGQTQYTLANLQAELAASRLELNGGSTAYFDDVRMISVPEPAGLLLAVLGAVGALCVTPVIAKRRPLRVQLGLSPHGEGRNLRDRVVPVPLGGPATPPGNPVKSGLPGKRGDISGRRLAAFCCGIKRPAMVRC
jgi:hypothetical protein